MDWKSPRFGSQLEVFESKQRKERLTQWMLHSNVVNEMFYTISKSRIFMGGSSIIPSHGRFMAARVSHYSFILGRRRMRRRKKKRKRMMRRTVRRKKTWICWRWFCYFPNPLLGESLLGLFWGGGAGCLKQIQETDEHNGSFHQLKHGSFLVHGYTQDLPWTGTSNWVNYKNLTATSLESWLIMEIIPKWP